MLQDFPETGASLSSVIDTETNYRYLVYDSDITFYRYEEDTVFIDRALYAGSIFMQILFGITKE